jgi:hypothetical protein
MLVGRGEDDEIEGCGGGMVQGDDGCAVDDETWAIETDFPLFGITQPGLGRYHLSRPGHLASRDWTQMKPGRWCLVFLQELCFMYEKAGFSS